MEGRFMVGQQREDAVDDAADDENADAGSDDARYAAVIARGGSGFFYGVTSTGVFCRPQCKARTPLRQNVRFFATAAAAQAAGFRACKRCTPTSPSKAEQQAVLVAAAVAALDAALDAALGHDAAVDLAAVADGVGVSRHHFHRVFVAVTGLTPGAWLRQRKEERLRRALPTSTSVTAAAQAAGLSSSSRLHAAPLGMTARRFRQGGQGERITFATAPCSLGVLLVARTNRGVCCLLLGDDAGLLEADLRARFGNADVVADADAEGAADLAAVVEFVDDPRRGLHLPLDVKGTAFQQRVWQALRDIPAGETRSYADVARALGDERAVRAVAGACAANPIAVAIPCHRVLKSDGAISGYRWGVARKKMLLAREAQD